MARKFLYVVAALVVVMIGGLLGLRFWAKELSAYAFVPAVHYEAPAPLPADAYAGPRLWLSRGAGSPGDPARFQPAGTATPAPVAAAVFFIHPTSHFDKARWHGLPGDPLADQRAALFARGLASPFAAAAELWAPRYRQATFGAFLTDRADGQKALDTAQTDVLAAFDRFVAEADPKLPIVIVGHSQGAYHALHLLARRVAGQPIARRIAAAYLVGWPVSLTHDLPRTGLAACTAPDQAGCVLSWQSFAEPADPAMVLDAYARFPGLDGQSRRGSAFLCTNPITGTQGGAAPAAANLGTLLPDPTLTMATLAPELVPARCDASGFLMIGPAPELGPLVLPGNNYHIYDIPLFWANVRADFARRVAAWHKANG